MSKITVAYWNGMGNGAYGPGHCQGGQVSMESVIGLFSTENLFE